MNTRGKPWKKWSLRLTILFFSLFLILWLVGLYLSAHYQPIVKNQLKESLPSEYTLDFQSLDINLIARSITVGGLTASFHPDRLAGYHHSLSATTIHLSGFQILRFLFGKEIRIRKIELDGLDVSLQKIILEDSTIRYWTASPQKKTSPIKSIIVRDLQLENLHVMLQNDTTQELTASIDLWFYDIKIPPLEEFAFNDVDFDIKSSSFRHVAFKPEGSAYQFEVKKVSTSDTHVQIDTLQMIPRLSKFEFAQHYKKEIDRLELFVPSLTIADFPLKKLRDSVFQASHIRIESARLKAFRDKRLPFKREKEIPMPIELFKDIPFTIAIDTLHLINTSIAYEEFPEHGEASGTIRFEDLDASFYHCYNDSAQADHHIDLDVRSRLMGSGLLEARFDLPLDPSSRTYRAEGALSDFDLTTLNPALENLAMVKIESGIMNRLEFAFGYNATASNGSLEIRYEDLKIISLKEKESRTVIDKFKTFLLNTFLIRKNKDEKLAKDKRIGKIDFQRDPNRSIFNYWWNSVFSGIKSSYRLEFSPDKNDK